MGIGRLSRETGCNTETIRYYERVGLMPDPPRTGGGHRVYGEDHLRRALEASQVGRQTVTVADTRHVTDTP